MATGEDAEDHEEGAEQDNRNTPDGIATLRFGSQEQRPTAPPKPSSNYAPSHLVSAGPPESDRPIQASPADERATHTSAPSLAATPLPPEPDRSYDTHHTRGAY